MKWLFDSKFAISVQVSEGIYLLGVFPPPLQLVFQENNQIVPGTKVFFSNIMGCFLFLFCFVRQDFSV